MVNLKVKANRSKNMNDSKSHVNTLTHSTYYIGSTSRATQCAVAVNMLRFEAA